jgi:hypothetical protein
MVRRLGDRLGSDENGLVKRGNLWLAPRVSNAEAFAQLVTERACGTVESLAVHSPGREMALYQLGALAVELVISLFFGKSGMHSRPQQTADVRAVGARFESSHFIRELKGFLLELGARELSQLFDERIDVGNHWRGRIFGKAEIHRLRNRREQPKKFGERHDCVARSQNGDEAGCCGQRPQDSVAAPQDVEDGYRDATCNRDRMEDGELLPRERSNAPPPSPTE